MTEEVIDEAVDEKTEKKSKRLDIDQLKIRVQERSSKPGYRGVNPSNVKWDTLRYDEEKRRQIIDIVTVDENGKSDGGIRTIATSDLQHTKQSIDVVKKMQKLRAKERRKSKSK